MRLFLLENVMRHITREAVFTHTSYKFSDKWDELTKNGWMIHAKSDDAKKVENFQTVSDEIDNKKMNSQLYKELAA